LRHEAATGAGVTDLAAEVVVLGGGLAGLSAAIEARRAGRDVLLLCKGLAGRGGNSLVAAGNLSGVHPGIGDDEETFVRDTLAGGKEIGSPALVRVLARGSREVVPFLESCGVGFARAEGRVACGANPGHSRPRTVCLAASGRPASVAGLGLTAPVLEEARRLGVRFQEGTAAVRIERDGGRAAGVTAVGLHGLVAVTAGAMVLASGGGARVYAHTNNAADATGDGILLAYEAGAELGDLEFGQFYPTMGFWPLRAVFPTTLFAEGAVLRDRDGERFLLRSGASDEAAVTRDEMSRAVLREVASGRGVRGGVLLDLSAVSPEVARDRCGGLWRALARRGLDPAKESVVVGPCAHFLMGGVTIRPDAATTVPGLFAAGEVTGGVHGANRLGGNALTEAVVFGRIAGASAAREAVEAPPLEPRGDGVSLGRDDEGLGLIAREVRALTWEHAGLLRSEDGLREGLRRLGQVRGAWMDDERGFTRRGLEVRSLLTLSRLILESALARTESRGAHWRCDFPSLDDGNWRGSLQARRGEDGEPALRYVAAG
jgi:succinate dehydrogenase/fumarate reductase flavoprotein subunit